MPVLKRRPRLVTFRVSGEEYREMAACCLETGTRSIAEFAREAVLEHVRFSRHRTGSLAGDLASVSRSLAELDAMLVEARKRIRNVLGNVHTDGRDDSADEQQP